MGKSASLVLSVLIFALVVLNFVTNDVTPGLFDYDVRQIFKINFFETHFLYYYALIFTILPPLLLSFDKKVHFVSKYKYLWQGILITAVLFILWDSAKAYFSVWKFNPAYLTGTYIGNLPIEEYLFFIIIPFACLFIYECLDVYKLIPVFRTDYYTIGSIAILIVVGIVYWEKLYTSTVTLITAAALIFHWAYGKATTRRKVSIAYLVALLPFLLVNGLLTGAFQNQPVVIYNPAEILNIRIVSIPVEDAIYLYPLLLLNISFYERSKNRSV